MSDSVIIDRELLQIVFDLVCNSMDFGSGFLVDEDVVAMRKCAEILGVDPMEATPRGFRCRYRGGHDPYPKPSYDGNTHCKDCLKIVEP